MKYQSTTFRLPVDLHKRLRLDAFRDGKSMNKLAADRLRGSSECVGCGKKEPTYCDECVRSAYTLGKEQADETAERKTEKPGTFPE